ncbi:hypothetical protein IB286_01830 [Spongiibacter sp. KMU-158]|uniref:Cysteine-rich CPCC domain-containing protein n=1 Tax=Spongiibacter pelagi TaxID=2760804 RepID=A0A927BY65_9GAMM|nr:CPCC family cysteine-rich protein [Spongiibacter pelagi]MBD2857728.1 hypothetical protein [Spongiibacter pelagi]
MIRRILQWLGIRKEFGWYQPEDPTPREQCPCCDYISLAERNRYLICPICFWEDEGQDLHAPDEYSGPNHMSLREGRENFLAFGACSRDMLEHVLLPEDRGDYRYIKRSLDSQCEDEKNR